MEEYGKGEGRKGEGRMGEGRAGEGGMGEVKEVSIIIPEGLQLSDDEKRKIESATENAFADAMKQERQGAMAKSKIKIKIKQKGTQSM